jgi:hypothetical protein
VLGLDRVLIGLSICEHNIGQFVILRYAILIIITVIIASAN